MASTVPHLWSFWKKYNNTGEWKKKKKTNDICYKISIDGVVEELVLKEYGMIITGLGEGRVGKEQKWKVLENGMIPNM